MSDMTKRFSDGARRIISNALLFAKDMGHSYIGSEHLLLGILKEDCVSARLLCERGAEAAVIKKKIIGIVGSGCKTTLSTDDMTPICRRIILRASIIASGERADGVDAEHLLSAMLREECVAVRLLRECSVDTDELKELLDELFADEDDEDEASFAADSVSDLRVKKQIPTPLLDANATDLTEKAKNGGVDPVIARESEEERVISILLRRSKNNPCLVGEAGVGKTAVVESVALRIARGNVPDELRGKRIMSLELSSVVAGTKYRGEFEEKIKKLLDEVRRAGDVILFIDELHTVVGAGGAEGAIDASNILKPALARGEIRVIGATTVKEFNASIAKDKALERRFQSVNIEEPNADDCRKMLFGLRERYEGFHNIIISDEAVDSAVSLSKRYIPERCMPDKAIDLIDEAAASIKSARIGRQRPTMTEQDIARAVEKRTGVPVSVINSSERERMIGLEAELKRDIIGQDAAISALCSAVRRARTGVRSGGRPNGSFLFVGSAGVGKTESAKALARAVFDSESSFIRLDMSEFAEPHSVSRIVGSPPGYVGYGEGGELTERVKRRPFSLLLFDEIEKAHPDVRALLLQILDEGVLTDSTGTRVRFDNTIVIMTANRTQSGSIGFVESDDACSLEAAKLLSPELADRVDEIILFSPLGSDSLCRIAENRACSLCGRLAEMGISANLSEDFASGCVALSRGKSARSVIRTAERMAEEAVAALMLDDGIKKGESVTICIENGRGIAKINQISY